MLNDIPGNDLAGIQQLTAKLLGYKDWDDAHDYRMSRAEDQKVIDTFKAMVMAYRVGRNSK